METKDGEEEEEKKDSVDRGKSSLGVLLPSFETRWESPWGRRHQSVGLEK